MKRVTASLIMLRCRFLVNKRALCLNEYDNGFAVPFEDTEWVEVGLVLGTKLETNWGKTVPICLNENEAGHGFAGHFEDTECNEVHDFKVNAPQRTNFMNRNIAMLLKYIFKMF